MTGQIVFGGEGPAPISLPLVGFGYVVHSVYGEQRPQDDGALFVGVRISPSTYIQRRISMTRHDEGCMEKYVFVIINVLGRIFYLSYTNFQYIWYGYIRSTATRYIGALDWGCPMACVKFKKCLCRM